MNLSASPILQDKSDRFSLQYGLIIRRSDRLLVRGIQSTLKRAIGFVTSRSFLKSKMLLELPFSVNPLNRMLPQPRDVVLVESSAGTAFLDLMSARGDANN